MKFRAPRHRIYRGVTICSGLIHVTLTLHAEDPQRPTSSRLLPYEVAVPERLDTQLRRLPEKRQ